LTIQGTGNQQILYFVNDGPLNAIPSQIYINDVLQDYVDIYVYNLEQEINYITVKWNEGIEIYSTYKMFYQLTNIIGIDIIDFIMPDFRDSRDMFHGCSNLKIINFYNIDTSKVKDMSEMFEDCSSLISLNLNTFDVSQVTSFWRTFNGCSNLLSLNLNNFVLKSSAHISSKFDGHNSNLKLCYDNSKAFGFSSVFPSIENNCDELNYMDNIYTFYSDDRLCPEDYIYLISVKNICVKNCFDDNIFRYRYHNECYLKCPKKTKIENFICIDLNCNYYNLEQNECIDTIEGYYLIDAEEKIVDACDSNCKTCIYISTKCTSCHNNYYLNNNECEQCSPNCINCDNYNICNLCIENYKLIKDNYSNKKCYTQCQYYYYFDEDGNYFCTESNECPNNFNKLIENKDKCIDKCINDDIHRLEYKNKCVSECPKKTKVENSICIDLYCNYYNLEQNECIDTILEGYYLKDP